MKLWLAVLVLLLGVSAAPVAGQYPTPQPAFTMYDAEMGAVRLYDETGREMASYLLPRLGGARMSPYAALIPGRPQIAYSVRDADGGTTRLVVYDYEADVVQTRHIVDGPVVDIFQFDVSRYAIANSSTFVYAFATLENGWPTDEWEIIQIDLDQEMVLSRLRADDLPEELRVANRVPIIYSLGDGISTVTFGLWDLGAPPDTPLPTFRWYPLREMVSRAPYDLPLNHDRWADTVVMPSRAVDGSIDPAFLRADAGPPHTSVVVQRGLDAPRTVTQTGGTRFSDVYLIADNRQVLARAQQPGQDATWVTILADGRVIPLAERIAPDNVRATERGFLYMQNGAVYRLDTLEIGAAPVGVTDQPGLLLGTPKFDPDIDPPIPELVNNAPPGTIPALADPTPDDNPGWLAWAYSAQQNRLYEFDSDGRLRQTLALPQPTERREFLTDDPVIDPTNRRLAYTSGPAWGIRTLHLFDLEDGWPIFELNVAMSTPDSGLSLAPSAFTVEGNLLYFGQSTPTGWRVVQVSTEYDPTPWTLPIVSGTWFDAEVEKANPSDWIRYLPIVFTDAQGPFFWPMPLPGQPPVESVPLLHMWIDEMRVLRDGLDVGAYTGCRTDGCDRDVLVTMPSAQPEPASYRDYMTVGVLTPQTGELRPIFYDDDSAFDAVFVVAGGQAALGRMPATSDSEVDIWRVIHRDGHSDIRQQTTLRVTDLIGTQDGLLLARDGVVYEGTVDAFYEDAMQPIIDLGADDLRFIRLWNADWDDTLLPLWTSSLRAAAPTAIPLTNATAPALSVGMRAVVTEAGNQVRMRVEPGGEIQRVFNSGAVVTIVGGPRTYEGLTYWQVDDGNGLVGWVAQSTGGEAFLAPVG